MKQNASAVFSTNLRLIREMKRMTQQELSDRSGIKPCMIADYESGARENPKLNTIKRLADGLGVKMYRLLAESNTVRKGNIKPIAGKIETVRYGQKVKRSEGETYGTR